MSQFCIRRYKQGVILKRRNFIFTSNYRNLYKIFELDMTMEQNLWALETPQNINESLGVQKCSFSDFQNKFQTIKAFADDLRQLQIQITAKEDSQIGNYIVAIVNYLSHSSALSNEKLYRNSLIGLGSFLSVRFALFKRQFLSQKFLKNLIEYFSIICQKQTEQDFNMLVYPVFYFIVLVIYNSDKDISNTLYAKLLTKKFLKSLCSVSFQKGNKIQRYLPVIIAFIAKGANHSQNFIFLKELVLNNIHFSEIEKNQFHFIYSLRVLINKESLTLGQVRRYSLLDSLLSFLNNSRNSEQHVTMILDILKHILKRHQILGYKIITNEFLSNIERCYKVCPSETLSLLQIISPCLPYKYKQRLFQVHSKSLQIIQNIKNQFMVPKQLQSLKIISLVIQEISFNEVMSFLQNFSLDCLLKKCFKGQRVLEAGEQLTVINLLGMIVKSFQNQNKTMAKYIYSMICPYRDQNRKIDCLLSQFSDVQCSSFCELE